MTLDTPTSLLGTSHRGNFVAPQAHAHLHTPNNHHAGGGATFAVAAPGTKEPVAVPVAIVAQVLAAPGV